MRRDLRTPSAVSDSLYQSAPIPGIRWPAEFAPSRAPVHVVNTLDIAAPPATVWTWLVAASRWPDYYPQAADVRLPGDARDLAPDMAFTWRTLGVALRSRVREWVPGERLSWDADGVGTHAYHAWLLTATARGTRVITEETQYGWLCRLGNAFVPGLLHRRWHQVWLERLAERATAGAPPV